MNNINTHLKQSNIFYELDNLALFGERAGKEHVDTNILFGEQTEVEMDCLTPKGKMVDLHEKLMKSWTPYAEEDSFLSKSLEKSTSSSYEELLDFVSFDSPVPKPKTLDEEETLPSKDFKDKVTENPAATIAGSTLLVSSVFFIILAILCPQGSPLWFAFYTSLSATTTVSGGSLLASTIINKERPFGVNPRSKDFV